MMVSAARKPCESWVDAVKQGFWVTTFYLKDMRILKIYFDFDTLIL